MKSLILLLLLFATNELIGQESDAAPIDSCFLYIPNIITMDCSSGRDYQLSIYAGCEMAEFEIRVYNRWGELLYQSTNVKEVWDASKVESGTLVYLVCGTTTSGQDFDGRGHVTILR